jgi:branched-chain amino acid transport system substrate-binding protein
MENSNTTTLAIVLIVGLVIGGGIGYFAAPSGPSETITETIEVEVNPLQGKTIQLGFITSQTSNLEYETPNVEDIIAQDINEYVAGLDYDVELEWLIDSADSQAAIHLEKVQGFKAMDVNIFMGGFWSSQAQAALSYVNDNDMLMISSSSTSPLLALPNDNLLRTCPTDRVQAPAIGEMLTTWGIEAVLIFQRGDAWADGIWNILEGELQSRGIEVIERIRYATESTEFSAYLSTMDDLIGDAIAEYGAEKVAIQTMSFNEEVVIFTQTVDYPNIREVVWFGCESSGRNNRVVDDSGGTQTQLRVFSSLMTPAKIDKWESYSSRYNSLTGRVASFYDAAQYDAMFIQAASILQVGGPDPLEVRDLFPKVANNWFGTSGWLSLDENGDRKAQIFDIWGYTEDSFQSWGQYNGRDIEVTWYDDLLAEVGLVRPSTQ